MITARNTGGFVITSFALILFAPSMNAVKYALIAEYISPASLFAKVAISGFNAA